MKQSAKSNKLRFNVNKNLTRNFIFVLLVFVCVVIAISPKAFATSCFDAVSVWATKIFPTLFPFFVLSRMIICFSPQKPSILDKLFSKIFNLPSGCLKIYLLSLVSGYPMGAKLVGNLKKENAIDSSTAFRLLSICSVSGPMFMIGTVGVAIFGSFKAGVIILVANILASLLNGLLFRKKQKTENSISVSSSFNLSEIVLDSMMSILLVGAFMAFAFVIIEFLNHVGIIKLLVQVVCKIFNLNKHRDVVSAIFDGSLEITKGIISLNATGVGLKTLVIVSSAMIGFGGMCVIMQSFAFLSKVEVKKSKIVLQKTTQAIFSLLVALLLANLFI